MLVEEDLDETRQHMPEAFFNYLGQANKKNNFLYLCLKCPTHSKPISCPNR